MIRNLPGAEGLSTTPKGAVWNGPIKCSKVAWSKGPEYLPADSSNLMCSRITSGRSRDDLWFFLIFVQLTGPAAPMRKPACSDPGISPKSSKRPSTRNSVSQVSGRSLVTTLRGSIGAHLRSVGVTPAERADVGGVFAVWDSAARGCVVFEAESSAVEFPAATACRFVDKDGSPIGPRCLGAGAGAMAVVSAAPKAAHCLLIAFGLGMAGR
jgi:hypothetical protein